MDKEKLQISTELWDAKIEISKIEAARRQIDCAIELWFLDKDEVSIHTLAVAAYQIIHDIKEHRGEARDLLYDSALIKDKYRKQWINVLKKAANFFKHADNDPDPEGKIEFSPFGNLMFIMFAISGLKLIGEQTSYAINALVAWLTINDSRVITDEFRQLFAARLPFKDFEDIRAMSKAEFFISYLRLSTLPR